MIEDIFLFLTGLSPKLKRNLWRWWYQLLAKSYQKTDWQFMNYGFCDLNSQPSSVNLDPEDETNRYFIQLYHHIATATDLENQKVLEVGCGRGGGAAYIAKYLKPAQMIGLDFSKQNIQLASKIHQLSNLSFQQGDAEALPFVDQSFDVVLNVESSHCYGSMDQFVQEVERVLKPGGIFSWADLRPVSDLESLENSFNNSRLTKIKQATITPNVLKALELVNEPKQSLINNYVPPFLKTAFQEFAAVKDSRMYQAFQTGQMIYLSYIFQKPKTD
jgi:ubiquinone/menaquinone biosynthesis C-methylase UbiE